MIIYILYFSLSRNNRRLQEFQSACRQGIIRTVASTDTAITNIHFLFVTTFFGDSEGVNNMHTIKVKCWEDESQKH